MIIDEYPDPKPLNWKAEIKLINEDSEQDEAIKSFSFEGDIEKIMNKIVEVEHFAFNYMKDHGCNLQADVRVVPDE